MKFIVLMAEREYRLRPHKSALLNQLIPFAGKPTGQRLVEDTINVCAIQFDEIKFISGDF